MRAIFITLVVLFFSFGFYDVTQGKDNDSKCEDTTALALKGDNLSSEDSENLEKKIKADPNDLPSRIQLLGYYFLKAYKSDSARKARQEHILWIIQNRPDAAIAGLPYAGLDPVLDKKAYQEARKSWLSQVETYKKNTTVLRNAANFFFIHDKNLTENLIKKAQALEPDNPEWPKLLGHLYSLHKSRTSKKESTMASLKQLEAAFSLTPEERNKFYLLADLAKTAFMAGEFVKAEEYSTELLNKAAKYKNDWNYGNAIHHGNLVIGRLALRSGDIDKAKDYLIRAGETPGSPQLNSFGPNMTLAKELLEKGEREIVIQYFELCSKFWKGHKDKLENWITIVRDGGIPEFGANLNY